MQPIHFNIGRLLTNSVAKFLKRSLFFALLYSTLLYIVVRLFFYEFPFTVAEGFELHAKIVLVVWIFIIACKLAFVGIVLLEAKINEMGNEGTQLLPIIKRSVIGTVKARLAPKPPAAKTAIIKQRSKISKERLTLEPELNF